MDRPNFNQDSVQNYMSHFGKDELIQFPVSVGENGDVEPLIKVLNSLLSSDRICNAAVFLVVIVLYLCFDRIIFIVSYILIKFANLWNFLSNFSLNEVLNDDLTCSCTASCKNGTVPIHVLWENALKPSGLFRKKSQESLSVVIWILLLLSICTIETLLLLLLNIGIHFSILQGS